MSSSNVVPINILHFSPERQGERLINNALFGGELQLWIHESEKSNKRERLAAQWQAWLSKHPLGPIFDVRVISLGLELYITGLGHNAIRVAGLTPLWMEMQVFPQAQQYVKESLGIAIEVMAEVAAAPCTKNASVAAGQTI